MAQLNVNNLHVRLIGHSFIRRLARIMNYSQYFGNLRLDYNSFNVSCKAKGGLTLEKLICCKELYSSQVPVDIVYLQIGGNDATKYHYDSDRIANHIVSFASFLHHGVGVKKIIIGQLFQREIYSTFDGYNEKIKDINSKLAKLCSQHNFIVFWHHHGFWRDPIDFLCFDGVHLNHFGMLRYFRSVRSSVLHAANAL